MKRDLSALLLSFFFAVMPYVMSHDMGSFGHHLFTGKKGTCPQHAVVVPFVSPPVPAVVFAGPAVSARVQVES